MLAFLDGAAGPDREVLLDALRTARIKGFVMAASVLTPGATTIVAAVPDPAKGEALAIGLAFPDSTVTPALRRTMQAAVVKAAERLRCTSTTAPRPRSQGICVT